MIAGPSSASGSWSTLPLVDSPSIGRDGDISRVQQLLVQPEVRILTLTGTGGVGKTRLAIEAANAVAEHFPGGVWFIELSSITDPGRLPATIATACGIKLAADVLVTQQLRAFFDPHPALIVLDNLEHIIDGAVFVAEVVDACPMVTILITSREPLRILGEREYAVHPLSLPDSSQAAPATILFSDAVKLYVARARATRPDFQLDQESAPAVAEICTRLDGLPLAIELAASRIKVLSPPAMASRLDQRFSILTSGPRDVPLRQRTLHDTIAWSYDLLDDDEQMLFRHVSVFQGGFSPSAAEAIERDQPLGFAVLGLLASLVDKSLVFQRPGADDQPRFGMLESIREFAWSRLVQSGEQEAVQNRHAAWFRSQSRRIFEAIYLNPVKISWLDRTEEDHDNLRAALAWLEAQADPGPWIDMVIAISPFWFFRSHRLEGEQWIRRALERAQGLEIDHETLGWIYHCLGLVCERRPGAIEYLEKSIELWEPLGLPSEIAASRISLSIEMTSAKRYEEAIAYAKLAIPVFEEFSKQEYLADQHEIWARAAVGLGDIETAREHAMIAMKLNVLVEDDWSMAGCLTTFAFIAIEDGNLLEALDHLAAARKHLRRVRSLERTLGWILAAAVVDAEFGHWEEAAIRFGAADQISDAIGIRIPYPEAELFVPLRNATIVSLGPAAFEATHSQGHAMPRQTIVDLPLPNERTEHLAHSTAGTATGPLLTSRELDVLRLLAEGQSDQEIANALFISRATASRHIANMYRKLDVRTRAAAVSYAHSMKIV